MEATAEDQENLADLEKRIVTTYCSQTSDTTTITLSLVSKTIRTDSQDLDKGSTERTECQTMDGVFLSVNEYATLLEKASFSPNFRDNLAKIWSHIAHLPQPKMDPVAFEKNMQGCWWQEPLQMHKRCHMF